MSDEGPDSLILRNLRAMDAKLGRMSEDMHEVKQGMTAIEDGLTGVRREIVSRHEAQVRMLHTLDQHGERLERIERRLDLLPA